MRISAARARQESGETAARSSRSAQPAPADAAGSFFSPGPASAAWEKAGRRTSAHTTLAPHASIEGFIASLYHAVRMLHQFPSATSTAVHGLTISSFGSVNARTTSRGPSRPKPDSFTPP